MKIRGHTKVLGIIGWPVSHSLSPVIHNAAFEHLDLDYCYVPFPVRKEDLETAVFSLKAFNIAGVNVTVPHKESIIAYLSDISREASIIGAVNTVLVDGDALRGYNTDGKGFIASMKELGHDIHDRSVLILGAGGAARAVAVQSAIEGAKEIFISNRTARRAEDLKTLIENRFPSVVVAALGLTFDEIEKVIGRADVVINTTSLGLHEGDPSPIPRELLHPGMFIYDLIYNPPETTLLRYAREAGCECANGLGMLVHQGGEAFKIWTGIEPPIDVMYKAARDALEEGE